MTVANDASLLAGLDFFSPGNAVFPNADKCRDFLHGCTVEDLFFSIVAVSPSIHLPDPRAWDQKSRDILILCLNKQVQRLPGVYAQGQASQAGSRSKTATCLFETSLFSKHNKLNRTLPSFSKGSNSICPVPWTNQWKEIVGGQLSSRLLLLLFPCTEARRGGSARLSESPDEQLLIQDFSLGELSTLLIQVPSLS